MFAALGGIVATFWIPILAANPSSTNFTLKAYDIGTGGGSGSSSNYKVDGFTNSTAGGGLSSTNYRLKPDIIPTQDTNVPPAPTLTNPSSYYNKLKLVLNTGGNPSDTKYAIAISDDGFTTTNYVKADNAIGTTLVITDYQTYTAWGGASGFNILGLEPNTTYQVKVTALQGTYSQSAYGPTASAATVQPSITLGVETSLSSTPPFTSSFSSLPANTIVTADADIRLSLTTNAQSGGNLYIRSLYSGLKSFRGNYTITSASTDLSSANTGYGALITATTQSSGGPLTGAAPYNGTGNNVGELNATLQTLATTTSPITNASLTMQLKAKTDNITPAETDYADTLTLVAAMHF